MGTHVCRGKLFQTPDAKLEIEDRIEVIEQLLLSLAADNPHRLNNNRR